MGVYINMEMPKSCYHCWALDDYGDYPRCRITEDQRGYNFPVCEKRMDSCPLVPVPPHGDLIDRDVLSQMYDPDESFGAAALGIIADTPTIIPADSSKEAAND